MSTPIRLGQVGVGYWGRNLLRNFRSTKGCEVVAVCDSDPVIRDRISTADPEVDVLEDFDGLISRADVDAIVVATQTPDHFAMSLGALNAGKHVFVEKPMARTSAEAAQLKRTAEERGLTLMTGHLLLYHPAFEYVASLIDRGDLGRVFYMYSTRVNLGIVRSDENALESLMPHDFSVALRMLGGSPHGIAVHGQAFLQRGIEDVVFATVDFDDGKLAHFHASWLDPHKARRVTIVGSQKMAVIDDVESVEKVRLFDKGVDVIPSEGQIYANYVESMTIRAGDIVIPRIDMREPLATECAHFIDCIARGVTPRSDGQNGFVVTTMMEAGMQSLREAGRRVEINLHPDPPEEAVLR
jgi:predicted dehydrogenase